MRTRVLVFTVSTLLGAVVLACANGALMQSPAGSPTPAATTSSPAATSSSQPILISMIQVLADPQKFHGKQVQVIGFAHFEFEGNAIYLSKEDFDHGITKNGLWLSVDGNKDSGDLRHLNNSYIVVEGTINAESRGHMGVWSGSIENITMLRRWAKVKSPQ